VDPITSVYIDMAPRQKHRKISPSGTAEAVASRVCVVVGFDFHQSSSDASDVELRPHEQWRCLDGMQRKNVEELWVHGPNYRNLLSAGASTK
jgi:hypothetical protein